jgi:hypothetical protein
MLLWLIMMNLGTHYRIQERYDAKKIVNDNHPYRFVRLLRRDACNESCGYCDRCSVRLRVDAQKQ